MTPEEGNANPGAVLHITVDQYTEHDGAVRISVPLKATAGIDAYVAALRNDLESAAKRARAALKNKQKAIREEIQEENALRDIDDRIVMRKTRWRRGWDSNPRWSCPLPVFETGPFNRSGTSPTAAF